MDRPPLEFANRVLQKFITNLFGEDMSITPEDFSVMRLVFRGLGGSWEAVSNGSVEDCHKAFKVAQVWGNSKEKTRKVELGY